MTLARRPGTLALTTGTIASQALSFYSFNLISGGIFTIIDTASSIYSANNYGATGDVSKIFTKASNSGQAYFQGIGNLLFFADGQESMKWNPTPLTAPPVSLLSSVAGGTLAATTYFVVTTYSTTFGETVQNTETSLAVPVNNLLVVNSPPPLSGATGWNVYVSTATKTETRQSANIPIGTNWTEPVAGLLAGASPPGSNTANPVTKWGIIAPVAAPIITRNSLANLSSQSLISVLLNGTTGYISTSQPAHFALPGFGAGSANLTNRSFAILFNTTATVAQPLIVVDDTQTGPLSTQGDSLFYLDSGGHVSYSLFNTQDSVWNTIATGAAYNDGQWHLAVCTLFNPGGNSGVTATIYVDGRQQASTNRLQEGDDIANFSGFYRIGGGAASGPPYPTPFAGSATQQFFNGKISHAAIWQGPDFSGDTWAVLTDGQVSTFWHDLITKGQAAFESDIASSQVTYFWKLTETSGTTALDSSDSNNGLYQGTVTLNQSTTLFAGSWLATHAYSLNTIIVDTNGFQQKVTTAGTSGNTLPNFATALNAATIDGSVTWTNIGPLGLSPTSSPGFLYYYSYKNNVTNHVSTASPASIATGPGTALSFTLSLVGSPDPQVDRIEIFRTADGGATAFFVADILNPGPLVPATYTDIKQDSDLNILIPAPIAHVNDPPPSGFVIPVLHLGRIWGATGNTVYASGGPDTNPGSGYEAFPPVNVWIFPNQVTRLLPLGMGLLVFTTADLFIIAGGPSITQFFSQPLVPKLGLSSYNALAQNGSEIYLFTSDSQLIALEPSAGISEVGFPIADVNNLGSFSPTSTYVTFHTFGSNDKALYISNNAGTWYRLNPHQAPDSMITGGTVWSPKATITGAAGAIQSIQITPGINRLLISQAAANSPVLIRDETQTIFSDSGIAYPSFATIGSIVLAQAGEMAELQFISAVFIRTGTSPKISVLIDEISGTFTDISNFVVSEPPILYGLTGGPISLFSNRYYLSQSIAGTNVPPRRFLQSLQVKIDFGNTDVVMNEILSLALYGGVWLE